MALFNLAIASKLRGCDLVSLRVLDIAQGKAVLPRAMVMQHKSHRPVQFEITEQTRQSVATGRRMRVSFRPESDTALNSWKKLITDIQSLIEWLDRLQSEAGPDRLTGLVIMAPGLRPISVCFWAFLRYVIWKALILLF